MSAATALTSHQMDRKCAVFGKRPARIESFRADSFLVPRVTAVCEELKRSAVEIISQARGVHPPLNHMSLCHKPTVRLPVPRCFKLTPRGSWLRLISLPRSNELRVKISCTSCSTTRNCARSSPCSSPFTGLRQNCSSRTCASSCQRKAASKGAPSVGFFSS